MNTARKRTGRITAGLAICASAFLFLVGINPQRAQAEEAAQASLSLTGLTDYYYSGKEIIQTVTVKGTLNGTSENTLREGKDYKANYKNNLNAGVATVEITGLDEYAGLSTVGYFNIISPNINSCMITGATAEQTYNPAGTKNTAMTIMYNGQALTEDYDYTVTYENNQGIGKATMTVVGINNFNGSAQFQFNIKPKDIGSSSVTVADISDKTYTGEEITPKVRVKDGSYQLTKGTDYKVSYEDNVDEGTATVFIKGKGNYSGERDEEFTIKKKKGSSTSSSSSKAPAGAGTGSTGASPFSSALSNLANGGTTGNAAAMNNAAAQAALAKTQAPKTGDHTTIPLPYALAGLSVAALIAIYLGFQNKKRKNKASEQ